MIRRMLFRTTTEQFLLSKNKQIAPN